MCNKLNPMSIHLDRKSFAKMLLLHARENLQNGTVWNVPAGIGVSTVVEALAQYIDDLEGMK